MEAELQGWSSVLENVHLSYEVGSFPKNLIPPHIRRNENDEPTYTTEEEYDMMRKQVKRSKGFDIDFTLFRSVFNYRPVDFDNNEFAVKPETTRELLKRLSENSLKNYNKEENTKYEFVKVVKANFHSCSGLMFLITFEVKDPYDNLPKLFQARVRYYYEAEDEYIFCRPKPDQPDKWVGTVEK